MAGGKWQSADKIIAEARMQETEELVSREVYVDPSLCWCGRPKAHKGRHRGSPGKSENLTGPDDPRRVFTDEPKPRIAINRPSAMNEPVMLPKAEERGPSSGGVQGPAPQLSELQTRYIDLLLKRVEDRPIDESLLDRIERLLGLEEHA